MTPSPLMYAPSAIDPSVEFGSCVTVWRFTTMLEGTVVGDDVVIGSNCFIGRNCVIGKRTRIQHGCFLPHGTVLGEDVFVGPGVMMTDDKFPQAGNRDYVAEPPVIGNGVSIGAGAVVLPDVEIGDGAMIAAGAVVTRDVPANTTAIGMPARMRQGA